MVICNLDIDATSLIYYFQIDEGIEYSLKATEIENNSLKARCFLTLGIGYSLKADQSHLHINRQKYQKKALTMFMR